MAENAEISRLQKIATRYRSRSLELETMFSKYIFDTAKRILNARSARPQEFQELDEKAKMVKTRGQLLEVFIRQDHEHKDGMNYEEFKNGMLLLGFMNEESTIESAFSKLDRNSDNMISENEFVREVLNVNYRDEYSFKSQVEILNREIKEFEMKSAEDSDEIEKLLLDNARLRDNASLKDRIVELEQENEYLRVNSPIKEEMDREILRLREFGTAMRSQLNLLSREAIVGARTAVRKIMGMGGSTEEELDDFDRETERSHEISLSRQVFINLDDNHMGDMDFEKFAQAYQWLNINASVESLRHTFNRLDERQTGLISEEQFLRAVISDVDPSRYTAKSQFSELMDRIADFDDNLQGLVGPNIGERLRSRLDGLRSEMDGRLGKLFGKLAGVTGQDLMSMVSPEVLTKHLSDAFDKFDNSNDGRLQFREFCEAWKFLGLKGDQEELRDAFDSVDTDKSGLVDKHEFITAIKDNRLTELNAGLLFDALGIHIESLADRFGAFNATQQRRRAQRKDMESTLAERLQTMVDELCKITGKPRDADKAEEIREMKETFDRFDRNGSGELNVEEYKKAWKFLGRSGGDQEMENAFKSVDIDNSGYIEWEEFIFSLEGEDAMKYGLLADMEILLNLLGEVSQDIMELRGERTDSQRELYTLKDRLATLQREVTNRTEGLAQRMKRVAGTTEAITMDDLDIQLESAFNSADAGQTGHLNIWQFSQAWMGLGLGGTEEELKDLYSSSDRLGGLGKGMDFRQFVRVVKSERLAELSLRGRLSSLEYLFNLLEGGMNDGTSTRRRLQRAKIDNDMYGLLTKMIDAILPCTDDALSQGYLAKRDKYVNLKTSFGKYDNPKQGQVDFEQYCAARRDAGFTGSDTELQAAFDNVDKEGSGKVDVYEFTLSAMGKKAVKVGSLGLLKILNKLLGTAVDRFQNGVEEKNATPNNRNAIRLNARKMVQRMTGFGGVDQKKLEQLGIRVDRRAHSITAGMLEHILHD